MQPKEFKFFYSFQNKSALVFFRKSMYLNDGFMTLLSGCYWDSGGKQGKNHAFLTKVLYSQSGINAYRVIV